MKYIPAFCAGGLLGLAFAILVGVLWAPGPPRPGRPIQDVLQERRGELSLDPETLARSWALADAAKPELDGYHDRIDEARQALSDTLSKDPVDRAEVRLHIDRIAALETQLRTREIEVMLSIRELLSPEQRRQLQKVSGGGR